jgi:hypothetical protein
VSSKTRAVSFTQPVITVCQEQVISYWIFSRIIEETNLKISLFDPLWIVYDVDYLLLYRLHLAFAPRARRAQLVVRSVATRKRLLFAVRTQVRARTLRDIALTYGGGGGNGNGDGSGGDANGKRASAAAPETGTSVECVDVFYVVCVCEVGCEREAFICGSRSRYVRRSVLMFFEMLKLMILFVVCTDRFLTAYSLYLPRAFRNGRRILICT